jgi:hypothetical protein
LILHICHGNRRFTFYPWGKFESYSFKDSGIWGFKTLLE